MSNIGQPRFHAGALANLFMADDVDLDQSYHYKYLYKWIVLTRHLLRRLSSGHCHGSFTDFSYLINSSERSLHGFDAMLKKILANKIVGFLARCEFWLKLGLRFWNFVGYVEMLAKFGAKLGFRV